MNVPTKQQIEDIFKEGAFSRTDAKHVLQKQYAKESLANLEYPENWFDSESRFRELLKIVEYLVNRQ